MLTAFAVQGCISTSHPDYSNSTITQFIPFANDTKKPPLPPFPNSVPAMWIKILGALGKPSHSFQAGLDTGSTGFAIGAGSLPNWSYPLNESDYPDGFEYLSSSHRLWTGKWVNKTIEFQDANVTANVPVLIVTKSFICFKFSVTTTNNVPSPVCSSTASYKPTPINPRYMGIGFGRESNEQPQGTPDKNPLLNIQTINGKSVDHNNMNIGYIINETGIQVGLIAENTKDFAYAKLAKGLHWCNDSRDYNATSMSVSINDDSWVNGTVLFDTGIHQAYLRITNAMHDFKTHIYRGSKGSHRRVLNDYTRIKLQIGKGDECLAYYNLIVNKTCNPMMPEDGLVYPINTADKVSFYNTGRHFFKGFDVLFDAGAKGGYLGLRWKGLPHSPYGGIGSGGVCGGEKLNFMNFGNDVPLISQLGNQGVEL